MRVAVIDLGTNTFNLLIVDISPSGEYNSVYNTKIAVKIGEGAMIAGKLLPEPIARAKKALTDYLKIIAEHKCEKTLAFATSGIRSTSNGEDFTVEVKEELGLDIQIIDGDEEAQLIYEGVDLAVKFGEEPMVVMDIGGGSTEFIIANNSGVLWKKSYDLGISRILQVLEPSDPLKVSDLIRHSNMLSEELKELLFECKRLGVTTMIGSSGSFDSFAEMMWADQGLSKTTKDVVSEEMSLNDLQDLHLKMIVMNWNQRSKIPGLVKMRVDTIHLASYLVQWVLEKCALERLLLSTYALKEGVLHRVMENRL